MKTFVWPFNSQEEVEEVEEEKTEVDPEVQQVVEYAKANFAHNIYIGSMQAGISQKEMMVLVKAFLTGYRSIAEAGMSHRLAAFVERVTGQKCFDEHDLTDQQRVQAIDLFVEFINSKL